MAYKDLDALLSSYTSLFKVVSVSRGENWVLLDDILNSKEGLKLTDIAFSETATSGMSLFTRFVSFSDFNMTSGILFPFPGDLEGYLLRKYKKLFKNVKTDSEAVKRFVSFFKLSRADGLEIRYEERV